MPAGFYSGLSPINEEERIYLESLIREDFERCHPDDTLDYLRRRGRFPKRTGDCCGTGWR
jgi:hypothetical protein